ncbi:MAG: SemiSWEET transporter [Bacteroidota bacterium]|nr:SemiSWEET transporter [Bacteroidota bacterium]|tara:strand:+ start:619 stop:888 length:270 start_codon:yes stop_codon:yes gene_type:complete
MNSLQVEIIGLIAASFTTFAFVPQVFKIWKNSNSSGVSISMYVIMLIGICIWLYYGFLIKSLAVIIANLVSGLLQLFIITFALVNRKNK